MTLDAPLQRPLQVMVIEADPVLRLGVVTGLSRFSDVQVVAEVETTTIALRLLAQLRGSETIAVLLLGLNRNQPLEACQQLQRQSFNVPILLLGSASEDVLLAALQMGIAGYCPQGSSLNDLVAAIRQVAAGQTVWNAETLRTTMPPRLNLLSVLRQNARSAGLRQIEAALIELNAALQNSQLSRVDRTFLTGRRRELKAARWFVKKLLPTANLEDSNLESSTLESSTLEIAAPSPNQVPDAPVSAIVPEISSQAISARDLQARLFDSISAKLQSGLENLTNFPREIDIFRTERKRELFYIILRQIEASLEELRFSQVQPHQLLEKRSLLLKDLWQAVTIDFFGRYYTLQVRNQEIEVIAALLQDAELVQTEILDRIPLFGDLYQYLLFQTPLTIDNTLHAASSPEAIARAIDLLENLTIQLANAVVQPLLNRFSDLEAIKQSFYDRRLLSTREIERFRNDLSWRYRVDRYLTEPKAIFESQHRLFVFTPSGIGQIAVYNPRGEELERLRGVGLAVTLALETRDAIAPRLRSAIAFLGSGAVYVLTEVIGRGIGLIGRGVVKGIGNAWQDSKRRES